MSKNDRHCDDIKELQKLLEFLKSEERSIEQAFEDVDRLARKVESLSNRIIGISS